MRLTDDKPSRRLFERDQPLKVQRRSGPHMLPGLTIHLLRAACEEGKFAGPFAGVRGHDRDMPFAVTVLRMVATEQNGAWPIQAGRA